MTSAKPNDDNPKLYNKLTQIFLAGYSAPIYQKWFTTTDEDLAYAMEVFWIAVIGRENLCNLTDGGEGGKPKGEMNNHAKLTEKQVIAIRADARKHKAIANAYNVAPSTISSIKNKTTWNHLQGEAVRTARKRLTPQEAIAIRSDTRFAKEIADAYGMNVSTIHCIKHRRNWKNLEGDCVLGKRDQKGERNYSSKLSSQDVIAIRSDPRPAKLVARSYGITLSAVYNIKAYKRWKHIS